MGYAKLIKWDTALIRDSAILTDEYVACDIINHKGFNTLYLDCQFTDGNADGFDLKFEVSMDGITYYETQQALPTGGVTSWFDNISEIRYDDKNFRLEFQMIADYIKISIIGSGSDLTNSLLKIYSVSCNLPEG